MSNWHPTDEMSDWHVMEPYRIKHWWCRWQSEMPDLCRFARRSRFPELARRKMLKDYNYALLNWTEKDAPGVSPAQRRRIRKAKK